MRSRCVTLSIRPSVRGRSPDHGPKRRAASTTERSRIGAYPNNGSPSLYAWQCREHRWARSTYQPILRDRAGMAGEAGVKRQYMGCAGRMANGINTVHLSYVRARTGHALIGARQWIPQEHIEDPGQVPGHGAAVRGVRPRSTPSA